ncbi:hypothetical protein CBOM_07631 [Ceraceosorus bombacis]|uniref:Uncharacterized protein n=1 Tax=Ceraceosorus bombacis TaxID=401625 RepID=A0A0P1BM23_9BASI|nr:hypothetical protein CBOM_07631 [Ceraceosorus bombacis]
MTRISIRKVVRGRHCPGGLTQSMYTPFPPTQDRKSRLYPVQITAALIAHHVLAIVTQISERRSQSPSR